MTTQWLNVIEQSGDATLGAALVRLANRAVAVHQVEAMRAAGGAESMVAGQARVKSPRETVR